MKTRQSLILNMSAWCNFAAYVVCLATQTGFVKSYSLFWILKSKKNGEYGSMPQHEKIQIRKEIDGFMRMVILKRLAMLLPELNKLLMRAS